ncbi:MAG: pseudaminic acid synthase [Desulfobulbaceae bacterium]|nr:pseudaminic acid synthase [Desulfobulbaceae bacterium]
MTHVHINKRKIGSGQPVYIIAEMSANHNQDFNQAVDIIKAAKEAGADAVKLQTYTPDTLTIDCDNDYFQIKETIWQGKNLYQLYGEAHTPWEWQPKLQEVASSIGLDFFSTPFDATAVDFLEEMAVPLHKVASFELVDLALLKKIGATGKPVIMSTGMASLAEIDEAVRTLNENGCNELALLKCTSAYPAPPADMNLKTIPHLADAFGVAVGLSDHTMGSTVAVAAVSLGACIVEKHFALSRSTPGPDTAFSLEPHEFKAMVQAVREAEKALGVVSYEVTAKERESRIFRRSLFVVKDMKGGEIFSQENVRSIRPGHGLHTRYLDDVLGRRAGCDIDRGTPLDWEIIGGIS